MYAHIYKNSILLLKYLCQNINVYLQGLYLLMKLSSVLYIHVFASPICMILGGKEKVVSCFPQAVSDSIQELGAC